ncbi:MAG: ABC transporter ATP-binding protein [Hyphomicrobiaceae bacterium]
MLEVKELVAGYGDAPVLHGVSISVPSGSVVSLVGANGAGKTTMLKTISGILAPFAGTILFEGASLVGLEPNEIANRRISHVPEGRQLFNSMTVRENLMLGAFPRASRRTASKNLDWVYSLFPRLSERAAQRAGTLSGGEQQMVAIGRGLMLQPRLLILDEPSLGLAPKLASFMFEVVDTISAEGVSILLVEQNLVQSLRHSASGYVMEAGRIVANGSSESLLSDAHTQAAYLGLASIV